MQNWQAVWQRRSLDLERGSLLAQLMAANGYDTGFGNIQEQAWRDYVAVIARRLALKAGHRVFEVGCGAGAFLLPLTEAGCQVGGLDYSETLLGMARSMIDLQDAQIGEARHLSTEPTYDVVISSGVFFYFPDLAYAREVLARMVQKADRAIAVLDLPDLAKRDEAMAIRRGEVGKEEYQKKYAGLDHLYFERDWFVDTLRDLGVRNVDVVSQSIAGYKNNAYRFNVVATL
jgi:2-polyprenyl-3-methyl-5-hydroxy-6-metoxy-1,4-benzoquinol methylase